MVRLTDHPDITLDVYHGCETTTTTNFYELTPLQLEATKKKMDKYDSR